MALTLAGLTLLIMLRLIPGTVVEQMIGADAHCEPGDGRPSSSASPASISRGGRNMGTLSLTLRWMPRVVWVDFFTDPRRNLTIMFLPALCLGTASAASIARTTRACMLDVLRSEYVRTVSAKGLAGRAVILKARAQERADSVAALRGSVVGDHELLDELAGTFADEVPDWIATLPDGAREWRYQDALPGGPR